MGLIPFSGTSTHVLLRFIELSSEVSASLHDWESWRVRVWFLVGLSKSDFRTLEKLAFAMLSKALFDGVLDRDERLTEGCVAPSPEQEEGEQYVNMGYT